MGMTCACGYRAGVIVPGVGYSRPGRAVGKTSRFWALCMAGACLAPGTGRGHTGVLNAWLLALAENARITQFGAARIAGEAPGRRLFAARFAQNLSALPQAQSGRKTQCMELHIDCVSCKMHIPHYMGPLWLPRFPAVRSRGGGWGPIIPCSGSPARTEATFSRLRLVRNSRGTIGPQPSCRRRPPCCVLSIAFEQKGLAA